MLPNNSHKRNQPKKPDALGGANVTADETTHRRRLTLVVKDPSELLDSSRQQQLRSTIDSTNDSNNSLTVTDSPTLRQALLFQHPNHIADKARQCQFVTTKTNDTPLLAASLSSPPVAIDLSNNRRQTTPPTTTTPMSEADMASKPTDLTSDIHQRQTTESASASTQYTNLLLQLRATASASASSASLLPGETIRIPSGSGAAARRKEKLRMMPCFQCPVCKKRFQRHIAMNAHFQNEHIAAAKPPGQGKICKLCTATAPDIMTLRRHLAAAHSIDLDNPLACLVEAEATPSPKSALPTIPPEVMATSGSSISIVTVGGGCGQQVTPPPPVNLPAKPTRSDDDDTSSSVSSDIVPSSLSSTPDQRMSPTLQVMPIKNEPESWATTTTNLTPKLKRSQKATTVNNGGPRKRKKRDQQQPATQYQCQFCLITFPNQTLYFLHRGFHGESGDNPWRCNGCGVTCTDMYDFNTHLVSVAHK